MMRLLSGSLLLGILTTASLASDPCTSGLQPGQRPGPYSALIATGPQRGQPTCYICETADRPAVVVFARNLSEPLAKLAQKLDQTCTEHMAAEFRSWVFGEILLFIAILAAAFAYAWKKGVFEWR